MNRYSVFSDENLSQEKLIALGREKLIELQNEAALRLNNIARLQRPNREWRLREDIKIIEEALKVLDRQEGASYTYSLMPGSREDIAERYVIARRDSLIHRLDEEEDGQISLLAPRSWGLDMPL